MSTGYNIYGPRDPAEMRNARERLAATRGTSKPQSFQPTEAERDIAEENPRTRGGIAAGRARIAQVEPGALLPFPFDPDLVDDGIPGAETPPFFLRPPQTFEELLFNVIMVNPSRESTVIIEQTVPAGSTGTATVLIPDNQVDVQRFFTEGGDGVIEYSIDVQAVGQTAFGLHRITGGERQFTRFWEKTVQVIVSFTNNDLINAALLQIIWNGIQIDLPKWLAYRNNIVALVEQFGIEP